MQAYSLKYITQDTTDPNNSFNQFRWPQRRSCAMKKFIALNDAGTLLKILYTRYYRWTQIIASIDAGSLNGDRALWRVASMEIARHKEIHSFK